MRIVSRQSWPALGMTNCRSDQLTRDPIKVAMRCNFVAHPFRVWKISRSYFVCWPQLDHPYLERKSVAIAVIFSLNVCQQVGHYYNIQTWLHSVSQSTLYKFITPHLIKLPFHLPIRKPNPSDEYGTDHGTVGSEKLT